MPPSIPAITRIPMIIHLIVRIDICFSRSSISFTRDVLSIKLSPRVRVFMVFLVDISRVGYIRGDSVACGYGKAIK